MSPRTSCMYCSTIQALSLCAVGVDCFTAGAHSGLGAGVDRSNEITLGTTFSSTVIVCLVM